MIMADTFYICMHIDVHQQLCIVLVHCKYICIYIYTCVNMRSVAGPASSLRYGVPTPFVGCGWVVLLVLRVCSTGTTTSTSTTTSR